MPRVAPLALVVLILTAPALAQERWGAELEGGREISVDPRSNRVTVHTEAGERQLWDGVHRLEDGTSITVRSGAMVPNAGLQAYKRVRGDASRALAGGDPAACMELILRTCGPREGCAGSQACGLARQLLDLHREERDGVSPEQAYGEGYLPADVQCRQALKDRQLFVPCGGEPSGDRPTACQRLAERVCGPADQCAERDACDRAHQFLATEARGRRSAMGPASPTPATGQCRRALDDEFFSPCEW